MAFSPLWRVSSRANLSTGMRTKDRLAQALTDEGLLELASRASLGHFDDFESDSASPLVDLVRELSSRGYRELAERVKSGEFDSTREEADAWAKSPEGQAVIAEFAGQRPRTKGAMIMFCDEPDCLQRGSNRWAGEVVCAREIGGCGHVWKLHNDEDIPPPEHGKNCVCGKPLIGHQGTSRAICPKCYAHKRLRLS